MQERSAALRRWCALIGDHNEELAKIVSLEGVSEGEREGSGWREGEREGGREGEGEMEGGREGRRKGGGTARREEVGKRVGERGGWRKRKNCTVQYGSYFLKHILQ